MLGYLSTDIIYSEKGTAFWERSSRKTVSFEEQTMSKDKYPSIFSLQMEAIVFIILQIFFATCAVLKIGEYSRIFPGSGWRIFGHMMCLDQSRASTNIWWIVWFDIFALPCNIVNMYMYIQMVVVYTVQSGWQKWRVLHPIEIVRLSILFCYMTDVHSVHCSLKCVRFRTM